MDGSSPTFHRLHMECSPSDGEANIRDYIEYTKATVASLDQRMEEMKARLAAMQAEKERHLRDINRAANLLSPIRTLPVEVITSIFLRCLEESDSTTMRNHPSVTISHVCQYWRGLALATPLLWSQISAKVPSLVASCLSVGERMTPAEAAHSDVAIDTFLHWSQNLDNVQHMVEAWTHRSMTCPIRLSLTSGERNASLLSRSTLRAARERFEAFVDILCASARRWAHVDFKLTFDPMTEDAVALFNLPSSEYEAILSAKVKLVDNSRSSSPVVETWVSNLASSRMFSAPFLTTVSFPGLWGDFAAARSLSTIPLYAFVTTLDFMGPAIGINNDVGSFRARRIQDVSAVLEVLRSFPLLVDCKICVRDFEAIRVPGTPVSLPHLKSMTLVGSTVCKGFAPSVHLPQLAVLAFEDYVVLNRPIDEWSNGVIEFLRIHGSHLSEVAFLPQVIPPSSILTCLQSIPNVLKLTISSGMTRSSIYRGVDIAWIKALQTPSLCPQLEVLEVKGAQNSQLDGSMEKAVVDMIISRRAGGSNVSPGSGAERETSLREIVVDFTDPQKVDMMKELRAHHPDVSDMDLKTAYSLLGCS